MRTMLKERARIHGLSERVTRYRDMTNMTIQYLLDAQALSIHERLSVSAASDKQALDATSPENVVKAANRLGTIFQPFDIPTLYRMLGVMYL